MKEFVNSKRDMTVMKCTEEFIEKGITPMITIEELQKSNTYKKVDKFLSEQGYKKVFVDKVEKDRFIIPAHYEYIK